MNDPLPTDLKSILSRASGTFVQDFAGVLSLVLLTIVGLSLPSVF